MKGFTALVSLLLLSGSAMAFTPNGVETSDATSGAYATVRFMGCDVTFKAENKSLKNLYINLEDSQVRAKEIIAGPWARLDIKCDRNDWKIPSKEGQKSLVCELDLMCNIKRQYKFKIEERGANGSAVLNSVWVYYPSESDWVDGGVKTIDLGNIGRHFN